MGEARRRKAAFANLSARRNVETGESVAFRDGGDPLVLRKQMFGMIDDIASGRRPKDTGTPCNGCRECCYHAGVDVHPALECPEDLAHLDVEQRDGGLFLRKREDGACVHLGSDGCTVYEHRPLACRAYDCRVPALFNVLDQFDGGHRQPFWQFAPKSEDGRVFEATCKMMGMAEFAKRRQLGQDANASQVATAVILNPKFKQASDAVRTLMRMKPDELRKMVGADKTAEQMHEEGKRFFGENLTTIVADAP